MVDSPFQIYIQIEKHARKRKWGTDYSSRGTPRGSTPLEGRRYLRSNSPGIDPRLLSREYEERGQIGKVDAAPLVQRSGSSGRVDNVDALAGVLSTYVLVHVCPLLAAAATVRAFEARSHPALVPKMTLQAFQHAVTVPTFRTHVVLPLPPAQPT